ncbi:MAG: DUF4012 domain-containing protein [Candidatus Moranbacteria bacterium]|nr:DUF4012 domain-containing protein [Candidatus Moranbacteria bacterium]
MSRSRIISQMFDIRPVDSTGDLDWEKIKKVEKIVYIRSRRISFWQSLPQEYITEPQEPAIQRYKEPPAIPVSVKTGTRVIKNKPRRKKAKLYQFGKIFKSEEVPVFFEISPDVLEYVGAETLETEPEIEMSEVESVAVEPAEIKPVTKYQEQIIIEDTEDELTKIEEVVYKNEKTKNIGEKFSFSDFFLPARFSYSFNFKKLSYSFALAVLLIGFITGAVTLAGKGLNLKRSVLGVSTAGFNNLTSAIDDIKKQNFESSSLNFRRAYENFFQASRNLDEISGTLAEISRFIPFASQLSSGKNALEAGEHVSLAGETLSEVAKTLNSLENPMTSTDAVSVSILELFQKTQKDMETAKGELKKANENFEKINIDDIPEDKRSSFLAVKSKLPPAIVFIDEFLANSDVFVDMLGGNGPRKYLFLFQNNQEMRPTGGFIGSYGLMDINNGRIRRFFVDGIFNPDGQLKDKIVPPGPIQKISAAWSLHDSNWWPDFPASARKAVLFYEKTGGPTVDGVITLTPTVMQKLLEITGPIEMSDYGVTIDSVNFIEAIQQEVEIDYDKEENQPKKILSDLAPIILDRLFNLKDWKNMSQALNVFIEGLNQKQILLYSQNEKLERLISSQGWSGEILDTSKDYLSVINTNINGYKTDGVIEETIEHAADIQPDGSIIDTVTITRKHTGGNSQYEWWNKVNADYMRVYVPFGSKLLEAEGQTREFTEPPLDYDTLNFRRDPDVQREEQDMDINQETGIRTYEEAEKTVFANWTYVSPGETVVVKYKYLLPFRISFSSDKPANSYSLLVQKQSGSIGSKLKTMVHYSQGFQVAWSYPENVQIADGKLEYSANLEVDKFLGLVFLEKR